MSPDRCGHFLVAPALWCGRHISALTSPLSKDCNPCLDIIQRLFFALIAAVALLPTVALSLAGLAIKAISSAPPEKPPEDPKPPLPLGQLSQESLSVLDPLTEKLQPPPQPSPTGSFNFGRPIAPSPAPSATRSLSSRISTSTNGLSVATKVGSQIGHPHSGGSLGSGGSPKSADLFASFVRETSDEPVPVVGPTPRIASPRDLQTIDGLISQIIAHPDNRALFEALEREVTPFLDETRAPEKQIAETWRFVKRYIWQAQTFGSAEPVADPHNRVKVKASGNCFYICAGLGIRLSGVPIPEGSPLQEDEFNVQKFREQVVDWIRNHYQQPEHDNLLAALTNALENYKEVWREKLQSELRECEEIETGAIEVENGQADPKAQEWDTNPSQGRAVKERELQELTTLTLEGYLDLARRDGFHASAAEQYAISHMYQVGVHIREVDDPDHPERGSHPNPARCVNQNLPHQFTVVYSGQGAHFDLYVKGPGEE